jgi:hypothetical protein
MKKRRRYLWALILLIACGGLVLMPRVRYPVRGWWRGETFYQGMPASYWSDALAADEDRPAEQARRTGLATRLETQVGRWVANRYRWYCALNPLEPMAHVLWDPGAAPLLRQLLRDDDARVRRQAARLLARLGAGALQPDPEEAAQGLLAALDNGDERVRLDAATALCSAGKHVPKALAVLLAIADSDNGDHRERAEIALLLGTQSVGKAAVPALCQGLKGSFRSRNLAADALAMLGADAEEALPALVVAYYGDSGWAVSGALDYIERAVDGRNGLRRTNDPELTDVFLHLPPVRRLHFGSFSNSPPLLPVEIQSIKKPEPSP